MKLETQLQQTYENLKIKSQVFEAEQKFRQISQRQA